MKQRNWRKMHGRKLRNLKNERPKEEEMSGLLLGMKGGGVRSGSCSLLLLFSTWIWWAFKVVKLSITWTTRVSSVGAGLKEETEKGRRTLHSLTFFLQNFRHARLWLKAARERIWEKRTQPHPTPLRPSSSHRLRDMQGGKEGGAGKCKPRSIQFANEEEGCATKEEEDSAGTCGITKILKKFQVRG